jgi:hypothetical protein
MFYARSRKRCSIFSGEQWINKFTGEYWAQKAHENSDNRGKLLRRDGFTLAEEKYGSSTHTPHKYTSKFHYCHHRNVQAGIKGSGENIE